PRSTAPVRPASADTLELARLETPQQGELRGRRKIADLVEEDGPAVGELEPAEPPFQRSGERALLVTEELRRDQCRRDGGTVDADEGMRRPCRSCVDGRRDALLPGSRRT